MFLHLAELAATLVAGIYIGYRYAKSKFAAGAAAVLADIKKL